MSIGREGDVIHVRVSSVNFDDYTAIKNTAGDILSEGGKSLTLVLESTVTVNSALIGYLIKLTKVNRVKISLKVGNTKLYDMMNTLSLVDLLNISRI